MATAEHLEDITSLLPALHLLHTLGYRYLTRTEANRLRDHRTARVVLEPILAAQLRKLNRIHFKGRDHPFSDANIHRAIAAIAQHPFTNLISTNQALHDLLTLGTSLEQTIDGYTRSHTLHYIDWRNPAHNVYHMADEFTVERHASRQTRRPDIVLFVNGLPLVVIECKRPGRKHAIQDAIVQLNHYQQPGEIPGLFAHGQLLLALAQNQARYATIDTPARFWSLWQEERPEQQDADLAPLINTPLSAADKQHLFTDRDPEQRAALEQLWSTGERLPTEQDRSLHGLCRPARLLELINQFIVFDHRVKKVARYQQYFAVGATLARVTRARGDQRRPGGVIWHTTGSGKSLTMVMLAKALALEPSIPNPKILLVTDRVDLDEQIYRTFQNCGAIVSRASSGKHLLELIQQNRAAIITTIIDKFDSAARHGKARDHSHDIFVLVDESHRSQYGVAHARMRNIFPNACYIGFTGTPLLRRDRSTAQRFGGFIHRYTMNQAVRDGTVAPLLYEGRMSELHGDQQQLDRWFERITRDLTDEQKLDLKKKFRREEELSKSDDRIREIAYDIGEHYCTTFQGSGLKGQLAAASKAMALRYHQELQHFGRVTSAVLISAPEITEPGEEDESTLPEVQRFWQAMMARHGNEKTYNTALIDAFKHAEEPEIIIVVDKLLTGFDAPRNAVLYLDKRLKEHNILQAIARVNRLFDGKPHGLIIDYRGIFGELNEAIDTYAALEREGFEAEDVTDTLTNVLEEIARLPQRHSNVWEIFKTVRNRHDPEALQRHLAPEDIRDRFYEVLRLYARTLQLALGNARFQDQTPADQVAHYKRDLTFFLNLRTAVQQRYGETVDYGRYEAQIRNLVNKYIGADAVRSLVAPVDVFTIDRLDQGLEDLEGDAAKADAIASRMKKTLTERMDEDPALYRRLSEFIDEAIREHRAKRLSDADYLERIRARLAELRGETDSDLPAELREHPDARAYFGLVREAMAGYTVGDSPAQLYAEMALKLETLIHRHKVRDWTVKEDIHNAMLNDMEDYLYSIKGRHDLPLDAATIDRILEGVLHTARRREGP